MIEKKSTFSALGCLHSNYLAGIILVSSIHHHDEIHSIQQLILGHTHAGIPPMHDLSKRYGFWHLFIRSSNTRDIVASTLEQPQRHRYSRAQALAHNWENGYCHWITRGSVALWSASANFHWLLCRNNGVNTNPGLNLGFKTRWGWNGIPLFGNWKKIEIWNLKNGIPLFRIMVYHYFEKWYTIERI